MFKAHPYISALIICLLSHFLFMGNIESCSMLPVFIMDCIFAASIGIVPMIMLNRKGRLTGAAFIASAVGYLTVTLLLMFLYNASGHKLLWLVLIFAAVITALYKYIYIYIKNDIEADAELRSRLNVLTVMAAGFALKLCYVLGTPYQVRNNDVGKFGDTLGHSGYISYLMENHALPDFDVRTVWQFYHPPLHHIICALFLSLNKNVLHFPDFYAEEGLQNITLFYTMCIMITSYRIFRYFGLKGKALLIPVMIMNFHPAFIYMSANINNDALACAFLFGAVLTTLEWQRDPSMKGILKIALCIGLGMMAKLSAAAAAPPIALVFLIVFIKRFRDEWKKLLLQFLCFGLVCAPLGLWYQVRSYIKWDVPLNYVQKMPEDSFQYLGDQSYMSRLTDFSLLSFTDVYETWVEAKATLGSDWSDGSSDPELVLTYSGRNENNPILGALKTSVFGEEISSFSSSAYSKYHSGVSGIMKLFDAAAVVLFWSSILIAAAALASTVYSAVKRLMPDLCSGVLMISLYVFVLASFIKMCADFPFTCTMNFRYITPTVMIGALFLGNVMQRKDVPGSKETAAAVRTAEALTLMFCVSSAIVYLAASKYQ